METCCATNFLPIKGFYTNIVLETIKTVKREFDQREVPFQIGYRLRRYNCMVFFPSGLWCFFLLRQDYFIDRFRFHRF